MIGLLIMIGYIFIATIIASIYNVLGYEKNDSNGYNDLPPPVVVAMVWPISVIFFIMLFIYKGLNYLIKLILKRL